MTHKEITKEAKESPSKLIEPKEGDLRVWWIPQVPMNPFVWPVKTPAEAKNLLNCLAEYDKFQLDNNIKPDYCNVGGCSVFANGEWEDWYDQDGNSIDDI